MALLERMWAPAGQPKAQPLLAFAVVTLAVAIAYFLAARLSLALLEKTDGVAVFWPAAGVASGIIIGMGAAARWPVVLGVMAATSTANLLGDRNLGAATFFAVANAGEAVLVAGLIERYFGPSFELNQVRRVIGFFAATIAGTSISGVVGTIGFVLFHSSFQLNQSPIAQTSSIWVHWLVSDGLGTITIAPLPIGLASLIRHWPPRREIAEGALALAVIAALCAGMVFLPNSSWTFELAIAALSPMLVWIAARLRPAFTAAATFLCAITIVWTTTYAVGLFGDPRLPIDERILSAQATILAASFGALVLAALFSERRLHESAILERESRLENALRVGGVLTFDWDLTSDQIRHSQNAEELLGLQSDQVLDGACWLARIHPDDRSRVTSCVLLADPDKPSHTVTFRYLRPDGAGEVWLEQIAVTQFNSVERPTRSHGLMSDITERKRFEQEISRARKSAELADRAKSSFLAAASHDLRQPLQTLRFLHASLEQQHPHGEGRKIVTDMGHSLDTMSSMLSSLLDVNQLEAGNLSPSKGDFCINDIFDSIAADFVRPVEEKGLQLHLVRSAVTIHSDKRMLEEIVRNLLSNAIRYTDGGKILLGCRRSGDRVRIEVWDSGVGIAQHELPYLFEEYFQGAEGVQRGGFGLGLAIVKRLGDILDHTIDVRSTAGKGTRFSIEVPLAQPQLNTSEPLQGPVNDVEFLPSNVLIIEDETSVRAAVTRFLKNKGIGTVVARTGNDALTLINQERLHPELVLSDYSLRGSIDGFETIKAVRTALGWNVPAIIMTGDTRAETIKAIAAHDIAILVKPFLGDELLKQMKQLHRSCE